MCGATLPLIVKSPDESFFKGIQLTLHTRQLAVHFKNPCKFSSVFLVVLISCFIAVPCKVYDIFEGVSVLLGTSSKCRLPADLRQTCELDGLVGPDKLAEIFSTLVISMGKVDTEESR